MKRNAATIFALLLLLVFFNFEIEPRVDIVSSDEVTPSQITETQYSFSQGDNYIEHNARRGSSSSSATTLNLVQKSAPARRSELSGFVGVRLAVANLRSERSYSYSCDFPFDHQALRELFYRWRSLRI